MKKSFLAIKILITAKDGHILFVDQELDPKRSAEEELAKK
jgi:hypothetical protein